MSLRWSPCLLLSYISFNIGLNSSNLGHFKLYIPVNRERVWSTQLFLKYRGRINSPLNGLCIQFLMFYPVFTGFITEHFIWDLSIESVDNFSKYNLFSPASPYLRLLLGRLDWILLQGFQRDMFIFVESSFVCDDFTSTFFLHPLSQRHIFLLFLQIWYYLPLSLSLSLPFPFWQLPTECSSFRFVLSL